MPPAPLKPTAGELFAGYGGLATAVEMAFGAQTRWVAEWDDAPSKILAHRFPDCPNFRDVTTVNWYGTETVTILSGGSPCQDVSAAGRRAGMTEGTRSNLWVAMREAIRITQPRFVVWENVRGAYSARAASASEAEHPHAAELDELTGRVADLEDALGLAEGEEGDENDEQWAELTAARTRLAELEQHQTPLRLRALGRVLGDLASLGYRAEWRGLKASDVGAPHARFRVFVLAELVADHGKPHKRWPAAVWDEEADVWRHPDPDIFGEADVYTDTFPVSGSMRDGMIYSRPAWESASLPEEALLRTPCAQEAGGGPLHPDDAKANGQTLRLTGQILAHEGHIQPRHALPTPRATRGGSHTETVNALLGTPRCADGVMQDLRRSENIENPRGRLEDMVALLPTPASNVAANGGSQDVAEHRLLPSPVAQPSGNTPEDHLRKKPGRTTVTDLAVLTEGGLLESGGKLIPTPTARDWRSASRKDPEAGTQEGGASLPHVAAYCLLPTPVTQPATGNGHARNLAAEAALIPTPRAQNGETRNNTIRERPKGEPQNIENALAVTLPKDKETESDRASEDRSDENMRDVRGAVHPTEVRQSAGRSHAVPGSSVLFQEVRGDEVSGDGEQPSVEGTEGQAEGEVRDLWDDRGSACAPQGRGRDERRPGEPGGSVRGLSSAPSLEAGEGAPAEAVSWGPYEQAIRRWERITGIPAPAPTQPTGKNGRHRLSATFVEWMMGLPPGWVTGLIGHGLSRNDALKALGNGVVPQQAAAALLDMRAALSV